MNTKKNFYNYSILHLINFDDVDRGGAQKILHLLLKQNVGTLTLKDGFFINKIVTLVIQYFFVFFRCFGYRPRCVFIHSRCYLPFVLIFKLFSIKVIFYTHAHYRKHAWLFRLFNCDHYLAVSEAVKMSLIKQAVDKNKIKVIYNPYIGASKKYTIEDNIEYCNVFGSVGSLSSWKGFREGMKFLNQIFIEKKETVQYRIIGEGSEKQSLTTLGEALPQVNVELKGFHSSPFSLLADVPFILIPSLEEGFGLVAIEAIYQNKIILYSDVPALREVCGNDPLSFSFDINSFTTFETAYTKAIEIYHNQKVSNYSDKRQEYIVTKYSQDSFYKNHNQALQDFGLEKIY
jgi:hypothetical protein